MIVYNGVNFRHGGFMNNQYKEVSQGIDEYRYNSYRKGGDDDLTNEYQHLVNKLSELYNIQKDSILLLEYDIDCIAIYTNNKFMFEIDKEDINECCSEE
jgi:hypothetical protein